MRKKYQLSEIDCANCALKLEDAIKRVDGVEDAHVNFLTQKLTLVANDECFSDVLDRVIQVAARLEPDCTIIL